MSEVPRTVDNMLIDPWSFMSFKGRFQGNAGSTPWAAPNWVADKQDRRRLQAYMLLSSYTKNMAREWMDTVTSVTVSDPTARANAEAAKADRREYGDPGLLVSQIVASVVGQTWSVVVPGAEEPVEDRKEDQSGEPVESPEYVVSQALAQWAEDEHFKQKVLENEYQQVELGDSVMVIGWSEKRQRPVVNVWDPGFYFPVWSEDGSDDEGLDEEFPKKVHLAYEFTKRISGREENYVRRVTYELIDGTCFMSDGIWRLRRGAQTEDIFDFDEDKGEYRVRDVNIGVDFIPVVHFPNFWPGQTNWGISNLSMVLQILDDLQATDTDLQATSSIVGSPPMALSGVNAPRDRDGAVIHYGPKQVFETGDGDLSMLDNSKGLDALIKYTETLIERLSVNSKVPESMLGRVKPSDVPSGIALWLSFAPHSGMIGEMRMVRHPKYRLVLKFVQKFMLANSKIEEVVQAELSFGSYLPADKAEAMKMVVEAMNATVNPISLETAVEVLVEAGFPIAEAQAEVRRIEQRMYEDALTLTQVTGDINAGRRLLGYDDALLPPPPTEEEEPAPDDNFGGFGG